MYTPREKAEMVLLHASGMSQRDSGRLSPAPSRATTTFPSPDWCPSPPLKERGSVQDKPRTGRPRSATGLTNSVSVTTKVTASPQRSIRKIAQESAIGRSSVHRILQRHKFHPYKTHIMQELHGDDTDRRMEICKWFSETREQQNTLEADIFLVMKHAFISMALSTDTTSCTGRTKLFMLTSKRPLESACGVASMAMLL
jgi:hypothetical protein